jgi:hypothetical protein
MIVDDNDANMYFCSEPLKCFSSAFYYFWLRVGSEVKKVIALLYVSTSTPMYCTLERKSLREEKNT